MKNLFHTGIGTSNPRFIFNIETQENSTEVTAENLAAKKAELAKLKETQASLESKNAPLEAAYKNADTALDKFMEQCRDEGKTKESSDEMFAGTKDAKQINRVKSGGGRKKERKNLMQNLQAAYDAWQPAREILGEFNQKELPKIAPLEEKINAIESVKTTEATKEALENTKTTAEAQAKTAELKAEIDKQNGIAEALKTSLSGKDRPALLAQVLTAKKGDTVGALAFGVDRAAQTLAGNKEGLGIKWDTDVIYKNSDGTTKETVKMSTANTLNPGDTVSFEEINGKVVVSVTAAAKKEKTTASANDAAAAEAARLAQEQAEADAAAAAAAANGGGSDSTQVDLGAGSGL